MPIPRFESKVFTIPFTWVLLLRECVPIISLMPRRSEHWPEFPQLGRRSADRCDVFPVALGVEEIYLNRLRSMKLMLCAAIGTAHWIDGRSYRPGPSKQQFCSARAIHHSLLRSWHQVQLAAQSPKADEPARNGHSLLPSTQKLDRPTAMSLWVRWSNTTYSPGDSVVSSLMRLSPRGFANAGSARATSGIRTGIPAQRKEIPNKNG